MSNRPTIDEIEQAVADIEDQLKGISGLIRTAWDECFPVLNEARQFTPAEMRRYSNLLSRLISLRHIKEEIA